MFHIKLVNKSYLKSKNKKNYKELKKSFSKIKFNKLKKNKLRKKIEFIFYKNKINSCGSWNKKFLKGFSYEKIEELRVKLIDNLFFKDFTINEFGVTDGLGPVDIIGGYGCGYKLNYIHINENLLYGLTMWFSGVSNLAYIMYFSAIEDNHSMRKTEILKYTEIPETLKDVSIKISNFFDKQKITILTDEIISIEIFGTTQELYYDKSIPSTVFQLLFSHFKV